MLKSKTNTNTDTTAVISPSNSSKSSSPSKRLSGLVKSGLAFRKNKKGTKSKKTKRTSSSVTEQLTAIANTSDDENSKTLFLVEDSNHSSTTEEIAGDTEDSSLEPGGLDLVVLLMHPISHRFELLQLEFDEAQKAKISDLLAQIPLSVTEDSLKDQRYDAILDEHSADKKRPLVLKSTKLTEAFSQQSSRAASGGLRKMVLVARPQGLSNADALKMAKPIFTNKDIANMLELSGFDVSPWKTKKFLSRSNSTVSLVKDVEDRTKKEETFQNSSTSQALLGLVFAILIAKLLQSVMIQPYPAGMLLKPGSSASKCGLLGYLPLKSQARDLVESLPFQTDLFSCQDEFLKVNRDGTATLLDADSKPFMIMEGSLCANDKKASPDCVDGLVLQNTGKTFTLSMGGKPVKQALVRKSHKDHKLAPWPFAETPKLNYKVGPAKAFA